MENSPEALFFDGDKPLKQLYSKSFLSGTWAEDTRLDDHICNEVARMLNQGKSQNQINEVISKDQYFFSPGSPVTAEGGEFIHFLSRAPIEPDSATGVIASFTTRYRD